VIKRLLSFCLILSLVSCAGDGEKPTEEQPVETLYNKALILMKDHEYKDAALQFEEVERQHPYSQWAARAELMNAYAQYQALDYDAASIALDQFIQMHPGNSNVAYAYYMKALCSYERIADVKRDPSMALESLRALQEIITRFPETNYAKDAILKIALVNDHLAGSEMEIGRYYIGQKIYSAALSRFKTIIEKYQTTSHVPEALHRLVECYLALGVVNEAQTAAAVLGHNFPGSPWYQDSYNLLVRNHLVPEEDKGSWVSSVWHTVF
jgi:outer membrane protein assembly factor BamD